MHYILTLSLVSLLLAAGSALAAEPGVFPGKKSKWQGFDMYQDGGRKVVVPAGTLVIMFYDTWVRNAFAALLGFQRSVRISMKVSDRTIQPTTNPAEKE